MEFAEPILLLYLVLCLQITAPLFGTVALILIRFALKDRQLTRNILYTVAAVGLAWLLSPIAQLTYGAVFICRECPGLVFPTVSELIRFMLGSSARLLLLFGIPCGFVVAFLVVVPATLVARRLRHPPTGTPNAPSA